MPATKIGNLFVDAVTRVQPIDPTTYTTHTLEAGEQALDYAKDELEELVLDVFFTDDRLTYIGPESLASKASSFYTTKDAKREALFLMKKLREVVDITTHDDFYPQYVISEIQRETNLRNAKSFEATVVFKKFRTTMIGTTAVPKDRLAKKPAAVQAAAAQQGAPVDAGTQPTPEWNEFLGG